MQQNIVMKTQENNNFENNSMLQKEEFEQKIAQEFEQNEKQTIKFVCISDTHSQQNDLILPEGDVLIHAGDFTQYSLPNEFYDFKNYIKKQKFKYKIVIAGNHEKYLDEGSFNHFIDNKIDLPRCKYEISPKNLKNYLQDLIYLQDDCINILGYKIYGTSWLKSSKKTQGFNINNTNQTLEDKWNLIPDDVDILITHMPPKGLLDLNVDQKNIGNQSLQEVVVNRIKPKAHIFGHVHESHGQIIQNDILFINAASCNVQNKIAFEPICFELPLKKLT